MSQSNQELWNRIVAGIMQHKDVLLHPDFPDEEIQRCRPIIEQTPFYVADNYAMRIYVQGQEGVCVDSFLRLGQSNPAEPADLFARIYEASHGLGLPIVGENNRFGWCSPKTAAHQLSGQEEQDGVSKGLKLLWRGQFFYCINTEVQQRQSLPTPPAEVRVREDMVQAAAHVSQNSDTAWQYIEELVAVNRVTFISAEATLVGQLHAHLSQRYTTSTMKTNTQWLMPESLANKLGTQGNAENISAVLLGARRWELGFEAWQQQEYATVDLLLPHSGRAIVFDGALDQTSPLGEAWKVLRGKDGKLLPPPVSGRADFIWKPVDAVVAKFEGASLPQLCDALWANVRVGGVGMIRIAKSTDAMQAVLNIAASLGRTFHCEQPVSGEDGWWAVVRREALR